MEYEIYYKPTYSLAEVRLSDGESIQADRRSMAYMSANLSVSTGIKGGVLRGLKRTVLGGADIFLNTFVAQGDAVVGLAPPYVGDIAYREIKDETLLIQGDSFLAGSQSLDLDTKWGGVKGFLSEAGLFFVKVSQSGYSIYFKFWGNSRTKNRRTVSRRHRAHCWIHRRPRLENWDVWGR